MSVNNPANRPHGLFTAHVGHYVSTGSYFTSYKEAADVLFQSMLFGEVHKLPDEICYPFIYLVRHTLELGHKATLEHLFRVCGERYKGHVRGQRHNLKNLHATLREYFQKAVKRLGIPQGIVNSI